MLDIESLTLGEIATVEELSSSSVSLMADESAPKAKLLIALAYVMKRRTEPSFTYNQAEALTMGDLATLGLGGGDADPEAPRA